MRKIAEQLPFTNEHTREQKLSAAVQYLRALLRFSKVKERAEFAELYRERYEPLIEAGELTLASVRCPVADSSSATESLAKSHARVFEEMGAHTRRIWRHNHIEYILFYALNQDLLSVAPILRHCLVQ